MTLDRFRGPRLKIERARTHLAAFRVAHTAFAGAHSSVTPATVGEGGLVTVTFTAPTASDDLILTAADTLYALRSALDQAACAAVPKDLSTRNTYFPSGKNSPAFEASLASKCKLLPDSVRKAIRAAEPFYGGKGYLLRALHDLNLVDKHNRLLETGIAVKQFAFNQPSGDQLANIQLVFEVTFADVEAIKGEHAGKVLVRLCDLVEETVGAMAAAAS